MTSVIRHPAGRGGRLWLQRRLSTASRAADLLEIKLRLLRREEERLAEIAASQARSWHDAAAEAELWWVRAAALGGDRGLQAELPSGAACVEVDWRSVMGVRYPFSATCELPEPAEVVSATAASPCAVAAYRAALRAGVASAAASAAAQVIAAEVTVTRGRLRAIEDRWIPRLQTALQELELGLDEQERADSLRLRWAAARRASAG